MEAEYALLSGNPICPAIEETPINEPLDFDQLVFDPHTGEDYSMSILDQGIEDLLIKI